METPINHKYPFIYISALMRTGSTVLSEMLTMPPHSFIFREPSFGKNTFAYRPGDIEFWLPYGVDLESMMKYRLILAFFLRRLRFFRFRQDYMVRVLKRILMPGMKNHVSQIGVKEIDNRGWQNYFHHFPNMKVIFTGRDPRDIYLSAYYKWRQGTLRRFKTITPTSVANYLNTQFQIQGDIMRATDYICVRYEDLCTLPKIFDEVKIFVNSSIPNRGEIGQFNLLHPERIDEYVYHGNRLTSKNVQRWKRERNVQLSRQAETTFDLMKLYCKFWGYKRIT